MKWYWKYKRQDYFTAACKLKEKFYDELKTLPIEYIESELRDSDLVYYQKEKSVTPFVIRLTLPLALIVVALLFVSLPITFIFTGRWGYRIEWLANWYKSLFGE